MSRKDLTPRPLLLFPCPSCGDGSGQHCLVHLGRLRLEPHLARKLSVAEKIERKTGSQANQARCNHFGLLDASCEWFRSGIRTAKALSENSDNSVYSAWRQSVKNGGSRGRRLPSPPENRAAS